MSKNKHSHLYYAPSVKEGVLFFLCWCMLYTVAQNNTYWLYLIQDDTFSLKIPVIIKNNKITIPAYPRAMASVADWVMNKDSVVFSVGIYENKMLLKKQNEQYSENEQYSGIWIRYSGIQQYHLPAVVSKIQPPAINVSLMKKMPLKWNLNIQSDKIKYSAFASFSLYQNDFIFPYFSGSIATPYGDLGNLNGYIQSDTLYLSVFNGAFATQVIGKVHYLSGEKIDSITGCIIYGNWGYEKFSARPDTQAYLKNEVALKEIFKDEKFILQHQWKDIDGKDVVLQKNKPVIILMMGTWCPNCADENKLFSEWYKTLSDKVQIIAMAVERHQHKDKSIDVLKKYRKNLNIPYPIVLLSENGNKLPFSVFPEIKKIPAFPTTIYFDKKYQPYKATIGFNGPATGVLYLQTQTHIQSILQKLSQ